MKYIVTAFFVALTTIGAFDVPSLTTDNYVEMTAGKTVLLKFFTTWVRIVVPRGRITCIVEFPSLLTLSSSLTQFTTVSTLSSTKRRLGKASARLGRQSSRLGGRNRLRR